MVKRLLALVIPLLFLIPLISRSQDFSNKGTDFWVGYGLHCKMFTGNAGGTQNMVLYFATESVTTITVSIPGLGYSQTYSNIAANTIFTTPALPKSGAQDARLVAEGLTSQGIHIVATKPVVAYAHIYDGSVSGATLLFPTSTLGKEYYSINFEQHSNETHSNSFAYAIATDTGTTTIEVVPSANTQTMVAGQTYTYNLSQGQVYNVLGFETGTNGVDLTGTRIRSISLGVAGCKRIAVFSGSGKINIMCPLGPSTNPTADNYMVQAFPKNAWGKYYLTVPTSQLPNNFFRIAVQDPTTIVKLNGAVLTGLINNFYYQVAQSSTPNLIEADQPVMVAQYITSASQCGNTAIGNAGDPEVIYLSPVEQNINNVIINSTPNSAITRHYVNVVIPNGGTAITSFKIDGAAPSTAFVVDPRNASFSYLVQSLNAGAHTIKSDSGFNAIAYGYGNAESYGYNAGANVKDLYQFVSIQNQYSTVNFPSTCRGTPFFFAMTFPYQPAQIKWVFGTALNASGLADVTINSPVYDSTWVVNGKQLYRYKLPATYSISAIGTYPIRVIAQNTSPDGCNGEQEIDYDLQVFERPTAPFTFTTSGCLSDSVHFIDNANTFGRPAIKWAWNFADGGSSVLQNPAHLYTAPGAYDVTHAVITDIGCISDTTHQTINISEPPKAGLKLSGPVCAGKTLVFQDSSSIATGTISKWTWNFGDGTAPVVATTNADQPHTYVTTGNYTVTIQVESSTGCKSSVFFKAVTVSAMPVASFTFGNACLPSGVVQFTDASTISDGTQATFTYLWTFHDQTTASIKNPSHTYAGTGPYAVTLVVTSAAGCADDTVRSVNTIYAQPVAAFTPPAAVCFGSAMNFTDASTVAGGTVTAWQWNFGDGSAISSVQNPSHTFTAAGTYTVTLTVTSSNGCASVPVMGQVTVNALPAAMFAFSTPQCLNGVISFTDHSTPNAGSLNTWTWNFGDGSSPSTQQNPTHTYSTSGTYDVTLQVTTDKGCVSAVKSLPVLIHPLPVVGFILPENCLNDPFSGFMDTSSIADGTQSQFSYAWNFGDAGSTPGNPNTSTVNPGRHRYTTTGNYTVTLTVTSVNGCSASAAKSFTVNGSVPASAFTVAGLPTLCSNDSAQLTDRSTVDVGRLIRTEIYWDYANNPTDKVTVTSPVSGAVYTNKYPEFYTPASKTYQVRVIAYSGQSCASVHDTLIVVKATPAITFSALPSICADQPAFQIMQASVTNLTGSAIFSGKGVNGSGLFSPRAAGAGMDTIRYTFLAANGCSNYKEQPIIVFSVPVVNAGPDKFILSGGNVVLNGSSTGSRPTYSWTPLQYLSNPTIAQPLATPPDDKTYTLTATTADGCSGADSVLVKVLKSPTIPNVFTPNNDGVNDKWVIQYLESYPGATVDIFNRYGSLVFHSVGYARPWDGTYNGKQMPAATYYYIINPKNGRSQLAGFVDIVR